MAGPNRPHILSVRERKAAGPGAALAPKGPLHRRGPAKRPEFA